MSDYDSDMEQFLSVRLVCLQFFYKGSWENIKLQNGKHQANIKLTLRKHQAKYFIILKVENKK